MSSFRRKTKGSAEMRSELCSFISAITSMIVLRREIVITRGSVIFVSSNRSLVALIRFKSSFSFEEWGALTIAKSDFEPHLAVCFSSASNHSYFMQRRKSWLFNRRSSSLITKQ